MHSELKLFLPPFKIVPPVVDNTAVREIIYVKTYDVPSLHCS